MAEYKITPSAVRQKATTTSTSALQRVAARVTRLDGPDAEWERVGTGWGVGFTPKGAAKRAIARAHQIIQRDKVKRAAALRERIAKQRATGT